MCDQAQTLQNDLHGGDVMETANSIASRDAEVGKLHLRLDALPENVSEKKHVAVCFMRLVSILHIRDL